MSLGLVVGDRTQRDLELELDLSRLPVDAKGSRGYRDPTGSYLHCPLPLANGEAVTLPLD
jgi:hypothetical protein